MTTIDASGMAGSTSGWIGPPPDAPTSYGAHAEPFDALALLREQVQERDEHDDDLAPIEVPGIGWRLLCDITFPYSRYAQWQTAALPKNQRNGRRVNQLKLDQTELAFNVLLGTCTELQYRRGDGEWETLVDPTTGNPLLPANDLLLRQFNVADPRSFLRKLFGREPRLVKAMTQVAAKAGWAEDPEEDGDDAEDFTT